MQTINDHFSYRLAITRRPRAQVMITWMNYAMAMKATFLHHKKIELNAFSRR